MEISEFKELMHLAIEQAKLCREDVPVGAIIVKAGEVIATGYNQREAKQDPLGHAELAAIKAAADKLGSWRLNGSTLVCTLEPCPMCAEAIIQARFDRLVFGAFDPICGAAGTAFNLFAKRKSLPTPELVAGILEEECSYLLKEFFRQRRQRQ